MLRWQLIILLLRVHSQVNSSVDLICANAGDEHEPVRFIVHRLRRFFISHQRSIRVHIERSALHRSSAKDSAYAGLWVILLVIPFLVYAHSDQTIHEKAAARQEQLLLDYAPLLWKMAMLLGAGLTIRGTFYRIAEEYRAQKAAEGKKHHPHFAYEEIQLTCIDLQNGMREALAYEAFGRRCGLPGYIKLGSLLSLNLQKGSAGLIALLEEEAREAMEERKSTAKKMGERAGTKLLLPMTAMLGVVLMILMVPAFLSM